FLSMSESALPGRGDLLVLASAFLFSVHIMVIDHFSPLTDGVRLSCLQFFTAGLFCLGPMLVLERPVWAQIAAGAGAILYAGVLSSGAAYTLQILGQKDADPTAASLILSLEAVFAALTGFLILHQSLSLRELGGCALMFTAIILAQLPERK
ncbi:MAG: DMT family transporter, partial [Solobacterium sp.]|nr:DMT family transporter [Solobacterium sp.]